MTSPLLIGLLVTGAGAVLLGGVFGTVGELPSSSWWVTAMQAPRVFGTAASLLAAAVLLLVGGVIRRHEWASLRSEDLPEPDAVLDTDRVRPLAG